MKGWSSDFVVLLDVGVGFLISFAVPAVPLIELLLGGEQKTRLHGRSSKRTTKSGGNGNINLILNFIGSRRTRSCLIQVAESAEDFLATAKGVLVGLQ